MIEEVRSFACTDCGWTIHVLCEPAANENGSLCAGCSFLRTVKDPEAREKMRALLHCEREKQGHAEH